MNFGHGRSNQTSGIFQDLTVIIHEESVLLSSVLPPNMRSHHSALEAGIPWSQMACAHSCMLLESVIASATPRASGKGGLADCYCLREGKREIGLPSAPGAIT